VSSVPPLGAEHCHRGDLKCGLGRRERRRVKEIRNKRKKRDLCWVVIPCWMLYVNFSFSLHDNNLMR
jgi:hypothetical protein